MHTSKLSKNMLMYLSVAALSVATGIGMFIGKDLYRTTLESRLVTPTQLTAEPGNPQPLIVRGARGSCLSPEIYTSLPPKCRTSDGSFIEAGGIAPYVILIPKSK